MDEEIMKVKMDEHLSNTKCDIRAALQRFEDTGIKIDRKFRRDFIKQTTDCVIDTCERYWDESKQKKSRKEKSVEKFSFEGERKSSKQQKTTKSTSIDTEKGKTCVEKEGQPRLKREKEEKPSEDCKRRKINVDVTDSSVVLEIDKITPAEPNLIVPADTKSVNTTLFFYCTHCTDMKTSPESTVGVGKIEDVYKHWRANHVIPMASKPFQFYVAEIAVCQLCDAVGTYRELVKHHQQLHPMQSFAMVSNNDRTKCGICLKSSADVTAHFESEHKAIAQSDFFNPMQFSDEKLDKLMKIEVHKKRQCGHCEMVVDTENELDAHHSTAHANKKKISKPHTDHQIIHMICGYCQTQVIRDEYFRHVKYEHPYVFKCWKCAYESKDLANLILHDKHSHERDTMEYHCKMFPNWLKTHFNISKVIFPNGLVMNNYNLIGTKFDNGKNFDVFIDSMVELTKVKALLLIKGGDETEESNDRQQTDLSPIVPALAPPDAAVTPPMDTSSTEDANFLLTELAKQNELANNLVILRLPRLPNMDLREMFLRVCDRIKVKISNDDIQHITRRARDGRDTIHDYRDGSDDTIVCLKSYQLKEEIRFAAQMYPVFSGDIFDLPPKQWSKKIKIISHTTRYYSDLLHIAKIARKDRVIHNYELSKHGIHLKRSPTSDDRVFIGKTELLNFINRTRSE